MTKISVHAVGINLKLQEGLMYALCHVMDTTLKRQMAVTCFVQKIKIKPLHADVSLCLFRCNKLLCGDISNTGLISHLADYVLFI